MGNLKILREDENPEILILTPLLTGDRISKETKKSIRRNETSFVWASFEGNGKHADNVQKGLECFKKKYKLPPYFQIIDNDIILGRGMLDRLYQKLSKSPKEIAFAYCPFSYRGHINLEIPAVEYDINKLIRNNYISSNSLYKTSILIEVNGFVTEIEYHRLSDWCMWLKLYRNKYYGILVKEAKFVAQSKPTDISAGSNDEYNLCKSLVIKNFIWPILDEKFNRL